VHDLRDGEQQGALGDEVDGAIVDGEASGVVGEAALGEVEEVVPGALGAPEGPLQEREQALSAVGLHSVPLAEGVEQGVGIHGVGWGQGLRSKL